MHAARHLGYLGCGARTGLPACMHACTPPRCARTCPCCRVLTAPEEALTSPDTSRRPACGAVRCGQRPRRTTSRHAVAGRCEGGHASMHAPGRVEASRWHMTHEHSSAAGPMKEPPHNTLSGNGSAYMPCVDWSAACHPRGIYMLYVVMWPDAACTTGSRDGFPACSHLQDADGVPERRQRALTPLPHLRVCVKGAGSSMANEGAHAHKHVHDCAHACALPRTPARHAWVGQPLLPLLLRFPAAARTSRLAASTRCLTEVVVGRSSRLLLTACREPRGTCTYMCVNM